MSVDGTQNPEGFCSSSAVCLDEIYNVEADTWQIPSRPVWYFPEGVDKMSQKDMTSAFIYWRPCVNDGVYAPCMSDRSWRYLDFHSESETSSNATHLLFQMNALFTTAAEGWEWWCFIQVKVIHVWFGHFKFFIFILLFQRLLATRFACK